MKQSQKLYDRIRGNSFVFTNSYRKIKLNSITYSSMEENNKKLFRSISNILTERVKPKINSEFKIYSSLIKKSKLKLRSIESKKQIQEKQFYFKRIFPTLDIGKLQKHKKLPRIIIKDKTNDNINLRKEEKFIKTIKIIKKEAESTIIPNKIAKKNIDIVMNEIIIKTESEKKKELEDKLNEEKEIEEDKEKKNKLNQIINEKKIIEEENKNEFIKENKKVIENNIKDLNKYKKEEENIRKKSKKDKMEILNVDLNKQTDKKIKNKCLKELELLIRHGSQLNMNNQKKLSNEIKNLSINYDNEFFDLITNIIDSMVSSENDFNISLINNYLELLLKNDNISDDSKEKALKLIIKINKQIGIIDGSEDLFWENINNNKLINYSIEGLYFLIQNCYAYDTKDKIKKLLEIFQNNYKNSEKNIKNYLCNIIQNLNVDGGNDIEIFEEIINTINNIDLSDGNFNIFSKILLNIAEKSDFNKRILINKKNIIANLIQTNKLNDDIISLILLLDQKSDNKIIDDFIQFYKNIKDFKKIDLVIDYFNRNNPGLEYLNILKPYINKFLYKKGFIPILYKISKEHYEFYEYINVFDLSENIESDIENSTNILNDGILFMDKNEIEKFILPKLDKIIFDDDNSKDFDTIIKFLKKNKHLNLPEKLKNLLIIYNSDIITKKEIDIIKEMIISKGNLPIKIFNKIINSKFKSGCEKDLYELIEIMLNENCKNLENKIGNNFHKICENSIDNYIRNIPKFCKNIINNKINFENDVVKMLNEKMKLKFTNYMKENQENKIKFLLLYLIRYFKFDELNENLQNFIITNINELCMYKTNDNAKESELIDNEFNTNCFYKFSIYYILESNKNFVKKRDILYDSISNSRYSKKYLNIKDFSSSEDLNNIYLNFNFIKEFLLFSIAFNYDNENEKKMNIFREKIKNLENKGHNDNQIYQILLFINELLDNDLINKDDIFNFLEKYIVNINIEDFKFTNSNRIKIFKDIRDKWIENNIEEIGIINNKKLLLNFIKEINLKDEEIHELLKIFKFKDNDNYDEIKRILLSFKKFNVDNLISYLHIFFKEETKSYEDLYDKLVYFAVFELIATKKLDVCKYMNFSDLSEKLIKIGWEFKDIEELFSIKIDFEKLSRTEYNEICDFICENKILKSKVNQNLENLIDIFSNYHYKEWEYQIKNLLVCNLKPYDFSSLITAISELNNGIYTKNEINKFANIIIRIKQKKYQILPESETSIKDIEIDQIKKYFKSQYYINLINNSKNSNESYIDFLIEIMAIINRGLKIFTQGEERLKEGYELRDVQLLAIVIILLTPKNKGIFAQIKTGQGKSIIIACLAVFKALFLKYVDILTSSSELASRDSKEFKNFYHIFNLTVSCTNEDNPYICNIVYGDTLGFEGDILSQKFNEAGKRMKNLDRGNKCLIIDEVDSICVDRLSESTLLTFYPKGFSVLEVLYPYIVYMYLCVLYCAINGYYGKINPDIYYLFIREKLSKGLKQFIDNNNIRIPEHLKLFVDHQIKKYCISIVTALNFHMKDVKYKIMNNKVYIVDNLNTGEVYKRMSWNDALHQFIQIKHGVQMTIEAMTTTFLCHYNFYMLYNEKQENNYETNIIGVTGTIGSESTKNLLKKIFNVNIIIIPPFCPSKFIRLSNKTGFDTFEKWRKAVVDEALENTSKNRPVLIITNSGKELSNFENLLKNKYKKDMIYTYEVNERDELKSAYSPGEILIGTNLAGRGTDLKLVENVEKFGGLHVIVTFIPINIRVEEQAFGRTARKGLSGTGRLIIKEYKNKKELNKEREDKEKQNLKFIEDNTINNLILKEQLFNRVCKNVNDIRHEGATKKVIDDLQEQWGLFFKYYLEDDFIHFTLERRNEILFKFDKFEKKLLDNIKNGVYINPLNRTNDNNYDNSLNMDEILCFYYYQYKAYRETDYKKISEYLNKFIKLAKEFLIPELYSIGTISILVHKTQYLFKEFLKGKKYETLMKQEEYYTDNLLLNIAKKIAIIQKIIKISEENIKLSDKEEGTFNRKIIRIEEFYGENENEKENMDEYFDSLGMYTLWKFPENNIAIDKNIDPNIKMILSLSQFICVICSKYSIMNDFELSAISIDDVLFCFSSFLNNKFSDIYTKISNSIFICIESIWKYFSNEFKIENKKKTNYSFREFFIRKKRKFDNISNHQELNSINVKLLDKLYEE